MSTDNLDIKIREAASQLEPAYNEKAWDKMEQLLDEHLPQKKRGNRKLFWIFLTIFLVAGSLILFNQTGKKESPINKENKTQEPNVSQDKRHNSNNSSQKNNTTTQNISPKITNQIIKRAPLNSFKNDKQKSSKLKNGSTITTAIRGTLREENDFTAVANSANSKEAIQQNNKAVEERNFINDTTTNPRKPSELREISIAQTPEIDFLNADQKDTATLKESPGKSINIKNTIAKKNKFGNSFFITISAGPDISAVAFDEIGKIKFAYGAGIGYNFGKKWNVRTGFYVEKKMYDAKPSSYHPPERFWYNFPDLKSIEADCKIYAVPVTVSYNFSENASRIWFGGIGIASYFMKKEVYDYHSKNPSGQPSYSTYTISDKNKHYFSIVRLSAGYEKKLGDQISFITEPYLAVPLAGVGYGKVKLYSSGVLLTLKVKPFYKK